MKKIEKKLYAIYKNKNHIGNKRAGSKANVIKPYLIAADLECSIYNLELKKQYSVILAINGVHHHIIKNPLNTNQLPKLHNFFSTPILIALCFI